MKLKKVLINIFKIIAPFLIFNFALAAIVQCRTTVCSWQDFGDSLGSLIRQVVLISYYIAMLMATIGAFLMMLHGANPSLYQKGKDLVKISIIAYVLILLSGVIFDILLEFFQIKTSWLYLAFLRSYLDPIKNQVIEGLRCGRGAPTALKRFFNCLFEAIGVLKNFAVILLAGAIIASAAYLISTPLFGLKNIQKAYYILIWSTIGLIIILLADIIKSQIEKLTQ